MTMAVALTASGIASAQPPQRAPVDPSSRVWWIDGAPAEDANVYGNDGSLLGVSCRRSGPPANRFVLVLEAVSVKNTRPRTVSLAVDGSGELIQFRTGCDGDRCVFEARDAATQTTFRQIIKALGAGRTVTLSSPVGPLRETFSLAGAESALAAISANCPK
jgi:hypothetical protein